MLEESLKDKYQSNTAKLPVFLMSSLPAAWCFSIAKPPIDLNIQTGLGIGSEGFGLRIPLNQGN